MAATGAVTSAYTDIGFMHVIPVNDVAQRLEWPRFPELELIAPGVGEEVAAFGFPDVEKEELSPDLTKVTVGAKLTTGKVDEHHHSGRGSWRFPQFRADAGFAHGMSGGPVVYDGKIAGVVSYAMTLDEETHFSYAAELWPLLAARPATGVDPRNMIPFESMLETGSITALGWRGMKDRIITGIDSSGARRIALKPPAG